MPAASPRQLLGSLGERLALEHYQRLGFRLLERNSRTSHGEIDLVVCDAQVTVFAEVKTRRAGGLDPLLSLTPAKRRRLRRLTSAWLADHGERPRTGAVRIDAVAIVVDDHDALLSLEQFEDVA